MCFVYIYIFFLGGWGGRREGVNFLFCCYFNISLRSLQCLEVGIFHAKELLIFRIK